MRFPLTLDLGPFVLSAHGLLELAAYVVGFMLLGRERRRHGDVVDEDARWSLSVAAVFGAVIGSKLVQWWADLDELLRHPGEIAAWLGGKSIVGGLLGGTLAVEWSKRRQAITRRTGDALVLPLLVSIAIGRVGCFLSGLADHTHGVATSLPWGVDFGDGIGRHPTQLYEIVFLGLLGTVLTRRSTRQWPEGARFDAFLLAYFAFRLAIDCWKPYPRLPASLGLAATQWTALAGILWRSAWLARRPRMLVTGAVR